MWHFEESSVDLHENEGNNGVGTVVCSQRRVPMLKVQRVCLVGFGYWGPNLARNIASSDDFELSFVFEPDIKNHSKIAQLYPSAKIISLNNELRDIAGLVDVGVIATPTSSHFELAKTFLNMDCHVWVEKPFTKSLEEATELVNLARDRDLKIFVDHTYLYTSAVEKIKSLISEIGEITYINSIRSNFGIIQNDSSVIWDLAVHDLSIISYLVEDIPRNLVAVANSPFVGIQKSTATLILDFETFSCTIHVNWLSPFKVREFTMGGTLKSIHFDDTKTDDKLRLYSQKIIDLPSYTNNDIRLYDYKFGEILIPEISNEEALGNAFVHFANYINGGNEPPSSGEKAIRIIQILAAAEESIENHGKQIQIQSNCGESKHV
jgi:predicted dehydrogenase